MNRKFSFCLSVFSFISQEMMTIFGLALFISITIKYQLCFALVDTPTFKGCLNFSTHGIIWYFFTNEYSTRLLIYKRDYCGILKFTELYLNFQLVFFQFTCAPVFPVSILIVLLNKRFPRIEISLTDLFERNMLVQYATFPVSLWWCWLCQ